MSRDVSDRLGVEECRVSADYVFNDSNRGNVSTRDLRHVGSLHVRCDTGRWGVLSELTGGAGKFGQPDLIGFVLAPFHRLHPRVWIIARYTLLQSFGAEGIRFARYESRIESGRGERYNEIHVGLSWLLYGHRLKLQTGVQYTRMDAVPGDDGIYRGWGWSTGLRWNW